MLASQAVARDLFLSGIGGHTVRLTFAAKLITPFVCLTMLTSASELYVMHEMNGVIANSQYESQQLGPANKNLSDLLANLNGQMAAAEGYMLFKESSYIDSLHAAGKGAETAAANLQVLLPDANDRKQAATIKSAALEYAHTADQAIDLLKQNRDKDAARLETNITVISLAASDVPSVIASPLANIAGTQAVVGKQGLVLKSAKDLEGKRIGMMKGAGVYIAIQSMCKEMAVDCSKINFVDMAPADQLTALKKGETDAMGPGSPSFRRRSSRAGSSSSAVPSRSCLTSRGRSSGWISTRPSR